MMNSQKPWSTDFERAPSCTPLWVLFEQDIDSAEEGPMLRLAQLEVAPQAAEMFPGELVLRWRLLDYAPDTEDEFVHQYFTAKFWRTAD